MQNKTDVVRLIVLRRVSGAFFSNEFLPITSATIISVHDGKKVYNVVANVTPVQD